MGVDSSDIAIAVPIRLSPGGWAVAPLGSYRARAGDLTGQLFHEQAEGRIPLPAALDEAASVNASRMIPAKVRADEGEGDAGNPAAQMHCHLAAERRALVPRPRSEAMGRQVESVRDHLADGGEPVGRLNAFYLGERHPRKAGQLRRTVVRDKAP